MPSRLSAVARLLAVLATSLALTTTSAGLSPLSAQAADQPTVVAGWNFANYVLAPGHEEGEGGSMLVSHVELSWRNPITRVVGTFRSPKGALELSPGIQGGGGWLPDCEESEESEECWPDVWTFLGSNLDTSADIGDWALVKLVIIDSTGESFVLTDPAGFTGPFTVKRSPKFQLAAKTVKQARPGQRVKLTITMRTKQVAKVDWLGSDRGLYEPEMTTSVKTYKSWQPLYKTFAGMNWRYAPVVFIYWKDSKGRSRSKEISTRHKKLNKSGQLTVSFAMPNASKVTGEVFFMGDWLAYNADFADFTIKKAKKPSKKKKTYTASKKTYTTSKITGIKIIKFK